MRETRARQKARRIVDAWELARVRKGLDPEDDGDDAPELETEV